MMVSLLYEEPSVTNFSQPRMTDQRTQVSQPPARNRSATPKEDFRCPRKST
jgi:hypothetical protein